MSGQDFFQIGSEELHYVGTHANAGGDFCAMQLDEDVNASLDDATYDAEFMYTNFSPYAAPAIIQPMADDIPAIKRVDSGLNARATSFIPQAWQQEFKPVARTNTLRQLQLLTPLKTDFGAPWQSAPHSAPPLDCYQDNSAVSPLLTFTDDTYLPAQGCQWPWPAQSTQDINAWAGSSSFSAGALGPNYVNPALLTPTSQCGGSIMSRSRSASVASATTYSCDHAGCPKSFKTKAEFSHHRRNHGTRRHDCEACHKKFVFRKDLTRHMKTHNPDVRDFFCSVSDCPYAVKGFQRKDHHDRHMKTHEGRGECPLTPITNSTPPSRTPSHRLR